MHDFSFLSVALKVNIWGPSDLKYLVDAMRSFIPNAAMVHTRSFGQTPGSDITPTPDHRKFSDPIVLIDDEVVKISAILLRPDSLKGYQVVREEPNMPYPSEVGGEGKRDHLPEPNLPHSAGQDGKANAAMKPGDISVIYVCELPEIKGKFDPQKALALGLKAGPKYRDLQLGKSVMSDRKNIMVGFCFWCSSICFTLFVLNYSFVFLFLGSSK